MLKNWLSDFFSRFLSRYTLRYPRSLVYMLQASEYNIRDYLAWQHKARGFVRVERRKRLVKTPKAILLLMFAWLLLLGLLATAVFVLLNGTVPRSCIEALLILLLSPYILAYGIIVPLFLIKTAQRPVEFFILQKARKKLKLHSALKIAIAGSFGKTTMREILKTVLSEGKKVAAPPHSYNTPLGISMFINILEEDEDVLIFELGEYYPGDIKKLCDLVGPDIGVITGINEAHLEKFKSLERTTATIFELADYLKEKPLYVNSENEYARNAARSSHTLYDRQHVRSEYLELRKRLSTVLTTREKLSYNLNSACKTGDWKIENPKTSLDGTSFTLTKGDTKLELMSKLLGLHQIGPLAAAADLALLLGLTPEQVQSGINKTKAFDHRLEPKTDASGVVTLDDSYNGNPDGVKAVIDFLSSLEGRRRWYVTPGLVEIGPKTEAVHRQIGRQLAEAGIENVILIKNSVTPYIEQGLQEGSYAGKIIWFDDALKAFAALPHLTAGGDVVLLQNDWPDQYQ